MSAHGIGAVALIQPGVEVWSTKRGRAGADAVEDDKPGDPIGGVVIHVTERIDKATGEVGRAFLCIDHTRTRPYIRFSLLTEDEVDRDTAVAVDPSVIKSLWRRLAEEIAFSQPHHPRRGPALAAEAKLGLALYELLGLVFGPDGILHAALQETAPAAPAVPRQAAPVNVSALVD